MRRSSVKWLRGLGVMVLSGIFAMANYGTGIPQAGAQAAPPPAQLLTLLNEINAKLNALTNSVGGIQEGHHTQRWDQNLPAAQRFAILAAFNSEAVLDKETGLVWEKSPATTTHNWNAARTECIARTTGGRKGWRLPSVHELNSLVDPSVASPGPLLSPGHPFLNVQSEFYWAATKNFLNPATAFEMSFGTGQSGAGNTDSNNKPVWCVRGGHNDGSEY